MRTATGWAVIGIAFAALGCSASADDTTLTDVPRDGRDGDGGGEVVGCVDYDRDGYGRGCDLGPDCDDTDRTHHDDCADCPTTHAPGCRCSSGESFDCYDGPPLTEGVGVCVGGTRSCVAGIIAEECVGQVLPTTPDTLCNDQDDDCDGDLDEELAGPCGLCDPSCESEGPTTPSPSDPGSSGLTPAPPPETGVMLGTEDIHAGYLYAANDPEGTVSKLDLETGAEVARYRVGLTGSGQDSPSRTAVDLYGNAYVASRAHVSSMNQGSVTKMAGDQRFCVDRNGNTVIDTSTGSTPLPLGTDECVLWTVNVGGPGGTPRGLAIDPGDPEFAPEGWVWVGLWSEMRAVKIDPDDGSVISSASLNVNPYGLAADRIGGIWVSGRGPSPGYLQRFDSRTGVADPPVQYGGAAGGCSAEPYGITVDRENRPWAACWIGDDACAARYDPATGTWFSVRIGRPGWGGRGIAAGEDGTIWMSIHRNWGDGAMARWNMADGSGLTVWDIAGVIPVGIGLDELGHVWTVNQSTSNVTRLTLATMVFEQFPVGPNPYTYSDFTGYQTRRLVPRGFWTRDYERCDLNPADHWGLISWDVTVPAGAAKVTISARSAATVAELDGATPVRLALVPPDSPTGSADIEAAFAAAGVPTYRYLRVTVILEGDPVSGASPIFRSVHVRWLCTIMG